MKRYRFEMSEAELLLIPIESSDGNYAKWEEVAALVAENEALKKERDAYLAELEEQECSDTAILLRAQCDKAIRETAQRCAEIVANALYERGATAKDYEDYISDAIRAEFLEELK